jgi:hypothetical protein
MPRNDKTVNRLLGDRGVHIGYDEAGTPNSAPFRSKHDSPFSYKASRGECHIAFDKSFLLSQDALLAAGLFEKGRILWGRLEIEADSGGTALRTAGERSRIISGLQDEITVWIECAKPMNAHETVVVYNNLGKDMNGDVEKRFLKDGSNANCRKEKGAFAEWSQRFDTLMVTP